MQDNYLAENRRRLNEALEGYQTLISELLLKVCDDDKISLGKIAEENCKKTGANKKRGKTQQEREEALFRQLGVNREQIEKQMEKDEAAAKLAAKQDIKRAMRKLQQLGIEITEEMKNIYLNY